MVMSQNTVLERLSLTNNDIQPDGIHMIARALEVNRSLVDLQLGYSIVGLDSFFCATTSQGRLALSFFFFNLFSIALVLPQCDEDCMSHLEWVLWDNPRREFLKLGGVPFSHRKLKIDSWVPDDQEGGKLASASTIDRERMKK